MTTTSAKECAPASSQRVHAHMSNRWIGQCMPDLEDGGARQLLRHQFLHELCCPGVHAGGALVQAHHPRPPQQHPRQAQQLLLPCAFTPPPSAPLLKPHQFSA